MNDRGFKIKSISDCFNQYLIHFLSQFKGKKDLVLGTELMKPLDRVAGAAMLKVLLILSSPVPRWALWQLFVIKSFLSRFEHFSRCTHYLNRNSVRMNLLMSPTFRCIFTQW